MTSASQHVPTDTPAIKFDHLVKIEAYSDKIMQSFEYVSDSSMAWRDLTPLDLVNTNANFQFLAHPIWWMSSGETRETKFETFLNQEISDVTTRVDSSLCYIESVLAKRHAFDEQFARRLVYLEISPFKPMVHQMNKAFEIVERCKSILENKILERSDCLEICSAVNFYFKNGRPRAFREVEVKIRNRFREILENLTIEEGIAYVDNFFLLSYNIADDARMCQSDIHDDICQSYMSWLKKQNVKIEF